MRLIAEDIAKATALHFKLTRTELMSDCQEWRISKPRQLAIALCREATFMSLPAIGAFFGGLNHTTVLHACREMRGNEEYAPHRAVVETMARRFAKERGTKEREWVERLHQGIVVMSPDDPRLPPRRLMRAQQGETYDPRLFIEVRPASPRERLMGAR